MEDAQRPRTIAPQVVEPHQPPVGLLPQRIPRSNRSACVIASPTSPRASNNPESSASASSQRCRDRSRSPSSHSSKHPSSRSPVYSPTASPRARRRSPAPAAAPDAGMAGFSTSSCSNAATSSQYGASGRQRRVRGVISRCRSASGRRRRSVNRTWRRFVRACASVESGHSRTTGAAEPPPRHDAAAGRRAATQRRQSPSAPALPRQSGAQAGQEGGSSPSAAGSSVWLASPPALMQPLTSPGPSTFDPHLVTRCLAEFY